MAVPTWSRRPSTSPCLGQYLRDMQFVLIVLAIGSDSLALAGGRGQRASGGTFVVAGNLIVNLVFFLEPSDLHALHRADCDALAVERTRSPG